MEIAAALEIVLDLARQSALTDLDDNAEDVASAIADQAEAIKTVEAMAASLAEIQAVNFETRFFEIVPNGYDFDNDHLSLDQTNALVKLIKEMPVNRKTTKGQVTHYEGWCETEIIYIDVTVNNPTGIGFNAFAGSENLMVESPANAAIYKAAFTGK